LRIEWARDGSGLLVRTANGVRIVDDAGATRHIPVNRPALDARWLGNGTVIAFDAIGMLRWHRIDGEVVDQRAITFNRAGRDSATAASIAGDGSRLAIVSVSDVAYGEQVGVWSADGERVWILKPGRLGIDPEVGRTTAMLSDDGRLIAIGYEARASGQVGPAGWWGVDEVLPGSEAWATRGGPPRTGGIIGGERNFGERAPHTGSAPGRGWLVIELASEEPFDRHFIEVARDDAPMAFAFDRRGRRFAHASPERVDDVGAIRLDRGDSYARNHAGGARCVAFDPHGVMVAYGYSQPPAGARGRLVVDYLARSTAGGSMIEIVDTLSIDPGVDVAAVAFSPDSRRIACLGSDGALEIVPVP
jgi:hypothetical protein